MSKDAAIKKLINQIYSLEYEIIDGNSVKRKLKWGNIIGIFASHGLAAYAVIYELKRMKYKTIAFGALYGWLAGLGITAGVHRLWTHRAYKAKLPLRMLLSLFFSMTGHNSIYQWVLDHRTHHKYTETDADPHNAARGFFFSHVGWLMQEKCHVVKTKGKTIDMSDILADPVVIIHERLYWPMKILMAFVLPTIVPRYGWGETWYRCILASLIRYILLLNSTWSVNSLAHIWGAKPYDRRIGPAENKLVAFLAMGEGWHNYHHVFPWDYRTAENGMEPNVSKTFIDICAKIGLAYDLKSPSKELVTKISEKYGDGTRMRFEVLPPEDSQGDEADIIGLSEVDTAVNLYSEMLDDEGSGYDSDTFQTAVNETSVEQRR